MSTLIQLLDRPIAYQPAFAQIRVGKVKAGPAAAVLLSQFVYWHNRMDGDWMYKTRENIRKETGLSRDEQETSRKRLVALGVLEEQLRGVPATVHYRINSERLEELLLFSASAESQLAATPPTRRREPRQLDGGNSTNKMAGTQPTSWGESCQQAGGDPANFHTGDYTETTQEITQNSSSENSNESSDTKKLSGNDALARKGKWGTPEDQQCAEWIFGRIKRLYEQAAETDGEVTRPKDPNWTVWANEIRLMRTIDARTHRQICDMFKRVQGDPFWCRNILSPGKLREKWDELILRLGPGNGSQSSQRDVNTISEPDNTIPEGFRG
ncbi:primosomal protein I [Scandinavium goeteborgense]|uniref:primosomal protein I n=1 Tax=Scandinavium goeteborgense TaxID=1851514 RepID=UPI0015746E26|nr:primosomal protein I [Scandinavium goeteborgense]QKN82216.1 primosomal protein I [Scandinavium goeteborgense]